MQLLFQFKILQLFQIQIQQLSRKTQLLHKIKLNKKLTKIAVWLNKRMICQRWIMNPLKLIQVLLLMQLKIHNRKYQLNIQLLTQIHI